MSDRRNLDVQGRMLSAHDRAILDVFGNITPDDAIATAARTYLDNGLSPIPIRADKKPAVSWKVYQSRRATNDELEQWIAAGLFMHGVGIVQGRVSRQCTADFDVKKRAGLEALARFEDECPDLADTLTITTPSGGRHFVYTLPIELLDERKRNFSYGDFLANGAYRAAPPTVGTNGAYLTTNPRPMRTIDAADIARIARHLGSEPTPPARVSTKPRAPVASDIGARALELYYAAQYRNQGAVTALCYLRDQGRSDSDSAVLTLAQVFQNDAPRGDHERETPAQRAAEWGAIVQSVFQRAPRIPTAPVSQTGVGLPNTIREHALRTKQPEIARVYDAALLMGYRAGSEMPGLNAFSKKLRDNGISIGRQKLGRWFGFCTGTKMKGDKGKNRTTCDHRRKRSSASASGSAAEPSEARQSGKPMQNRILLSELAIAEALQCEVGKFKTKDLLTIGDCATNTTYRKALQRELVKREAGRNGKQYSRKWLAERVGVCVRTISHYNRDAKERGEYEAQETIEDFRVTLETVDTLLVKNTNDLKHKGQWLEDEDGKRYSPFQDKARLLLGEGHDVMLRRRMCSTYKVIDNGASAQEVE